MIKRTIVLEEMSDGWVITQGADTWNVVYSADEYYVLHPCGTLEPVFNFDGVRKVLRELDVL